MSDKPDTDQSPVRTVPVILFDLCKGLRGFEAIFFFIFVIYYKIFVPLHTMLAIRTDQV